MHFDGVTGVAGLFPVSYPMLTLSFKFFLKKNKKGWIPPQPPAVSCNTLILFSPIDNHSHLVFILHYESRNPLILH